MPKKPLIDITVDSGKYRIVQWAEGGAKAYRYEEETPIDQLRETEPWLDVTNTPGANMILALVYELEQARDEVDGG